MSAPVESNGPQPPEGYVAARVLRIVLSNDGGAVLLQSQGDGRILPIFIGGTEALSIGLRHESRRYPRPLTHDLLDRAVENLGGKLVKVHVDALTQNVFVGRVFFRQDDHFFDIDARPSDALALALGNRVPIFVASSVLDEAAVRPEDLAPGDDEMPVPRVRLPDEPTHL